MRVTPPDPIFDLINSIVSGLTFEVVKASVKEIPEALNAESIAAYISELEVVTKLIVTWLSAIDKLGFEILSVIDSPELGNEIVMAPIPLSVMLLVIT